MHTQNKVIENLSTELVMFPGLDCKTKGVDLWGDLTFREDQVKAPIRFASPYSSMIRSALSRWFALLIPFRSMPSSLPFHVLEYEVEREGAANLA
jgi:hypothetical protein